MPAIRPFDFSALPKLGKSQVALQQSMALHLAYVPLQDGFKERLTGAMQELFGVPAQLSEPQLRAVSRGELGALTPALGCFAVLGMAPSEHKLILDLDPGLAAGAIERLLGGSGSAERFVRAFTEMEYGVLSFALLRILALFSGAWQSGRELSLSLLRFAATLEELDPDIHDESGFVLLSWRLALGKQQGYARLLIPDGLVTQRFGSPLPQSGATDAERAVMRRGLQAIGERQVTAYLRGARIDLAPAELAGIEAGDIIVLENHGLRRSDDGIVGEVFVTLGRGRNGGIRAELFVDASQPDQARLRILGFVAQEHPSEGDAPMQTPDGELPQDPAAPLDAEAAPPGDNLAETEGLLRDIDAPVVVELGRIKLNTAQVVRLRAGQILRLTRGPNDPVDLVVGGKVFARGELIDVEGELGVKLTQVAG